MSGTLAPRRARRPAVHQSDASLEARVAALEQRLAALAERHDELLDELRHAAGSLEDRLDEAHGSAPQAVEYRRSVRAARNLIRSSVPRNGCCIVVGKAGSELLDVPGRVCWAFPRAADGRFAGYTPASSLGAIAHLESLRAEGASWVLVPEHSRWWLDHYQDFRAHLERRYRLIEDTPGAGVLFSLREVAAASTAWRQLEELLQQFVVHYGRRPSMLDGRTGAGLAERLHDYAVCTVASDAGHAWPYLDDSIDVAVAAGDASSLAEARRVAAHVVVTWRPGSDSRLAIEWKRPLNDMAMPSVSIVIPCFDGSAMTERTVAALVETLPPDQRAEIVIVDDLSTDGTAAMLAAWRLRDDRIKVLRNDSNLGFLRTANRGAAEATGEILVFMNNDVIPLPGWLTALLVTMRSHADAGAVGGRLIYPDGKLQEAGGLVFADGSAANFGRDDYDPEHPHYSFFREAHYCSAALLATPAAVFRTLGGFDGTFAPGYYEDTDYCFRVRALGMRVYFQPKCNVVHVEGGTAGLDTAAGMKRYQLTNAQKFAERWKETLKAFPVRPSQFDFASRHGLTAPPPAAPRSGVQS